MLAAAAANYCWSWRKEVSVLRDSDFDMILQVEALLFRKTLIGEKLTADFDAGVLGSLPMSWVASAVWPDGPPNRGVAFSEFLIPVVCIEPCVNGDNEDGVEQKDGVMCGTPRKGLASRWRAQVSWAQSAQNLSPSGSLRHACACGSKNSTMRGGRTDKDWEKCACDEVFRPHPPSLTRESLLPATEIAWKKKLSLVTSHPGSLRLNMQCSSTVSRCSLNTVHPLCAIGVPPIILPILVTVLSRSGRGWNRRETFSPMSAPLQSFLEHNVQLISLSCWAVLWHEGIDRSLFFPKTVQQLRRCFLKSSRFATRPACKFGRWEGRSGRGWWRTDRSREWERGACDPTSKSVTRFALAFMLRCCASCACSCSCHCTCCWCGLSHACPQCSCSSSCCICIVLFSTQMIGGA